MLKCKTLPNKRESQKTKIVHASKDVKPLPCPILCKLCHPKSRLFKSPRAKFYHIFLKHVKIEKDFLDAESKPIKVYDEGFEEELRILKQISYVNQMGWFVKN